MTELEYLRNDNARLRECLHDIQYETRDYDAREKCQNELENSLSREREFNLNRQTR